MSVGHLLLAAATTVCILIGIMLEECDLAGMFSGEYRRHREHGLLLSWRRLN
jgi:protein-S-isoprenylcysteine O-methyltransferase Ste14